MSSLANRVDSEELQKFIKSTVDGIENALGKKYYLSGPIQFELAVVNVKGTKGGLKLFVVDASGQTSKENVSKIKFEIRQRKNRAAFVTG